MANKVNSPKSLYRHPRGDEQVGGSDGAPDAFIGTQVGADDSCARDGAGASTLRDALAGNSSQARLRGHAST